MSVIGFQARVLVGMSLQNTLSGFGEAKPLILIGRGVIGLHQGHHFSRHRLFDIRIPDRLFLPRIVIQIEQQRSKGMRRIVVFRPNFHHPALFGTGSVEFDAVNAI